ncbi:MadC family VWA domain-containing protein [Williamsia soli]|uniref:MadC family VWA domain-containing protein n=1 Tax=Williamsia soli TaxID=364929 RepID=UPI001A9EB731|nr:VWA domain-containing protein [Williamsia soli]
MVITRDPVLDVVAGVLSRMLRRRGVRVSPAETIEARRVLALFGGDIETLRPALQSVMVKYDHEVDAFAVVFQALFVDGPAAAGGDDALPKARGTAGGLPEHFAWDDEFEGASRMIGADEHTDEIGDLVETDPDGAERHGDSAHREENDFTVSAGAESLAVDPDSDSVSGGITYTIEVDNAGAAAVGEMASSPMRVRSGVLTLTDAAAVLAGLDGYDARRAYSTAGDEDLTAAQLDHLIAAIEAFVDALTPPLPTASPVTPAGEVGTVTRADLDQACHRIVRRMRGAPRTRARPQNGGRLAIRPTLRAALKTDGDPVRLFRRTRVPGRIRLVIVADVSLSVRPVAGFILRMAQALHDIADRCTVFAFVDDPVDVTTPLLVGDGDDALARVLSAPGLDLSATSDYGLVLERMLSLHGGLLDRRTSVLIVGDARSNGFAGRPELLRELRRRVHRLAWITPEPSRYWNQAGCDMTDYSQHCDTVVSARDAAELIERADEIGTALS